MLLVGCGASVVEEVEAEACGAVGGRSVLGGCGAEVLKWMLPVSSLSSRRVMTWAVWLCGSRAAEASKARVSLPPRGVAAGRRAWRGDGEGRGEDMPSTSC